MQILHSLCVSPGEYTILKVQNMEVVSAGPTTLLSSMPVSKILSSSATVRAPRYYHDSCQLAVKNRILSRTILVCSNRIHRNNSKYTTGVSGDFKRHSSGSSSSADPTRRWHSFPFSVIRGVGRRSVGVVRGRQGWEDWIDEAAVDESLYGEQTGQELDSAVGGEVLPAQPTSSAPLISLLVNYSVLVSDWWLLKNTIGSRVFSGLQSLPVTQLASQVDMSTAKKFLQKFRKRLPWGSVSESGDPADPLTQGVIDELAERSKERTAQELEEEMTSVADDLDPSILWEQRPEDMNAEKGRGPVTSPGFSFSAAGLLFPYHLGVCECLQEYGYIRENTPLSGSSAGAIVCAVVASGVTMRAALEATKKLSKDCREKGTAFRLGAVLRKFLEDFLPDDAHIRASGRIRVAVTCVFRSPRGLLVEAFDSKEDLINALITSSFIPGYLAPAPMTWFRDRYCIDGGISLFMPPTASKKTVRVCAFPFTAMGLDSSGISPDLIPEGRAPMRELFKWALEPASDDVLEKLFAEGYRDTKVWVENNGGEKPELEQGQLGEAGELAAAGGVS